MGISSIFSKIGSIFSHLGVLDIRRYGKWGIIILICIIVIGTVAIIYPWGGIKLTKMCIDTDNERFPTVKGICTDSSGEAIDTCLGSNELVEYSCIENECSSTKIKCDSLGMVCYDGSCTKGSVEANTTSKTDQTENTTVQSTNSSNTTAENTTETINTTNNTILLPDLTIQSINQYYMNSTEIVNVTNNTTNVTTNTTVYDVILYVSATVFNNGNYPSDKSSVNFSLTGPMNDEHFGGIDILEEGKIAIASTNFQIENYTGTFKVIATVDWAGKIKESNEDNNEYTITFDV